MPTDEMRTVLLGVITASLGINAYFLRSMAGKVETLITQFHALTVRMTRVETVLRLRQSWRSEPTEERGDG